MIGIADTLHAPDYCEVGGIHCQSEVDDSVGIRYAGENTCSGARQSSFRR